MENISITTYRGLSLVSGSISIRQMFEFIRGDIYRDRIRRLREAMDAGETVKADHMKKQLPYCTITLLTPRKGWLTVWTSIRTSSRSTVTICRQKRSRNSAN
ncbi:hypothetical protein [Bacteroides sp. AM54-2NS]|uniref:hypothetical protein n=1 Tax=Bacteroides sp. AM54-2NS TaxID=2292955 RepID=UPI0025416170|nr:hypothetical protein [Bacteroides sp. AM54-2NS]